MDTIVIEVKFIEEQIGDEVDAGMESGDDQQHIRVLGRGGIVVLDANRLGDWNIQFHIGSFSNPPVGFRSNVTSVNSDAISTRLSKFLGLTNSFWLPPLTLLSPPRPQYYLPRRHCTGAYIYLTPVDW